MPSWSTTACSTAPIRTRRREGVVWIGATSTVVGRSASWGVAIMLAGAGLVGLAILVARIRPIVGGIPARL